jgi:hypothetical protein
MMRLFMKLSREPNVRYGRSGPGGRLLFTSPAKLAVWNDAMTGAESISLGTEEYRQLLGLAGISVIEEYEDAGENHYFDAFKKK